MKSFAYNGCLLNHEVPWVNLLKRRRSVRRRQPVDKPMRDARHSLAIL